MAEEEELSIWDHLEELSQRLRRILFVIVLATVLVVVLPGDLGSALRLDFSNYRPLLSVVIEIIQDALLPEPVNLLAIGWLDMFYIFFLVAFVLGMLITMPYTVYELFKFISPALYPHEKRRMYTFVFIVTLLFSIGALYAWFVLLPTTFNVLYGFVFQSNIVPLFAVKDFFNMVAFGILGSGIFYTFPLIIWMLVSADLIGVQTLKENRKQLFIGLIIVTAVLTPDPTPFSMLLMSIPFYILYEITIQVLSRVKKEKRDPAIDIGIQASREMLSRTQDPDT